MVTAPQDKRRCAKSKSATVKSSLAEDLKTRTSRSFPPRQKVAKCFVSKTDMLGDRK